MSPNKAPPDDTAPGHVAIARVLSAHGLRGELNVELLTDRLEYFAVGQAVFIAGERREVETRRHHKQSLVVKVGGIDDVEAAEALRGKELSLPEDELAPLGDGEYYTYQLIGLRAIRRDGEVLGEVVDVFPTGSNDVYVVKGARGEILLPAVDDVVVEVDLAGGKMVVELMEGMLPEGSKLS